MKKIISVICLLVMICGNFSAAENIKGDSVIEFSNRV